MNATEKNTDGPPILVTGAAKGGTGKSTTIANIAASFARQGHKVLMLDFDSQGSATRLLAPQDHNDNVRRLEALKDVNLIEKELDRLTNFEVPIESSMARILQGELVKPILTFGVGLVGYHNLVNQLATGLTDPNNQIKLTDGIDLVIADYQPDVVLIDTPPSHSPAFSTSLTIATHILSAMEPSIEGLRGVMIANKQRLNLNRRFHMDIELAGVIPVGVTQGKVCEQILQIARIIYGDAVTSSISHGTVVKEASIEGMPVYDYEEMMRKIVPEYQKSSTKFNRIGAQFMEVARQIATRIGLHQAPPLTANAQS